MTQPEIHEVETSEESVELVPVPVGEPDQQIATAKQYPRSITRFRREALSLACLDEDTAGDCLYALPRAGKTIEGPSVRFAEILLYAWGNARAEAEVIEEGATHLTAQGTFFDLERNVAIRKKVKRRITDKHGRRYNEDMIGTTGNAAISIALRNVTFVGIPKALWRSIYEAARKASIGEAGTLTQTRQKMLDHFGKMGVSPEKLFARLGVVGIEDIKEDQVITMRGLANAIKDGEASIEDVFNPRAAADPVETPDLNARLKQRAEEKA
jgi:hypothetical protein